MKIEIHSTEHETHKLTVQTVRADDATEARVTVYTGNRPTARITLSLRELKRAFRALS